MEARARFPKPVWRCPGCSRAYPSLDAVPQGGCCAGVVSLDARRAAAELRRHGMTMTAPVLRRLEADAEV